MQWLIIDEKLRKIKDMQCYDCAASWGNSDWILFKKGYCYK